MIDKILKLAFIILLLLLIYMCTLGDYFFVIKMNWRIKLPRADEIVYESDTCSKSYMMCATYTVVKYNSSIKIKNLKKINWNNKKDITIETIILKELNQIVIDEKNMINFADEYWYYQIVDHDDELFLVYFPKKQKLYIIEQLR